LLAEISVNNFKSLNPLSLKLKPLTILIGPNGSGKSSVLQALLVLKKLFLRGGNIKLPELFVLDNYVNMGSWTDITYKPGNPIKIGVSIVENNLTYRVDATLFRDNKVNMGATIVYEGRVFKVPPRTISLPYTQKQQTSIGIDIPQARFSLMWDGFIFTNLSVVRGALPSEFRNRFLRFLNTWFLEIYALPLFTSMFNVPQVGMSLDKAALLNIIRRSLIVRQDHLMALMALDPDIEDYAMSYVKELFGIDVRGRPLHPNIARILTRVRKGKTIPIVNEGGGINRAVYMFLTLALANPGSTVLIEEPETNLHPKAQYELAAKLVETVNEGKQIILTTHSEHLLFGVLGAIAKNIIPLNSVAIYYFRKEKESTMWRQLEIDEKGRVKGGLPGFFEEDIKEILELLRTLRPQEQGQKHEL